MDLMEILTQTSAVFAKITVFILIIHIIFSLLNCFFGYRLFKIWMALCGFLLGGIIAAIIVCNVTEEKWIRAAVILAAAVICALISYQVYLIGAFFIGWCMTFVTLRNLFSSFEVSGKTSDLLFLFSIFAGFAAAILIVKFSKPAIIIFTGISGAVSAGGSIAQLMEGAGAQMALLIGIILAAAGIFVQMKMNHGLFHRK